MAHLRGNKARFRQWAVLLVLLLSSAALSSLLPNLWGSYGRILAFTILLYMTLALSYDIVGGLLGYLYLGHGLFFGRGRSGRKRLAFHDPGQRSRLVTVNGPGSDRVYDVLCTLFRVGGLHFQRIRILEMGRICDRL